MMHADGADMQAMFAPLRVSLLRYPLECDTVAAIKEGPYRLRLLQHSWMRAGWCSFL